MQTQLNYKQKYSYIPQNLVDEELVLSDEGYEKRSEIEKNTLLRLKEGYSFYISLHNQRSLFSLMQKGYDLRKFAKEQGITIVIRTVFNKNDGSIAGLRIWNLGYNTAGD